MEYGQLPPPKIKLSLKLHSDKFKLFTKIYCIFLSLEDFADEVNLCG